jgi:hypothetical protein
MLECQAETPAPETPKIIESGVLYHMRIVFLERPSSGLADESRVCAGVRAENRDRPSCGCPGTVGAHFWGIWRVTTLDEVVALSHDLAH